MNIVEGGTVHRAMAAVGRACVRRPWSVIGAWLLLAAVVVGLVAAHGRATDEDATLPGSEGQRGRDLIAEHFPGADGGSGQVIVRAGAGRLDDEASRAAIASAVEAIGRIDHVTSVTPPEAATRSLSGDGKIGYLTVSFDLSPREIGTRLAGRVMDAAGPVRDAGLEAVPGGVLARPQTSTRKSEVLGLGIAAVVMVFAFGGLVAAGLPLVTALITLVCGIGAIGLAGHLTSIPSVAATVATMIGLGVGIDYALFLVTRYRSLLSAAPAGAAPDPQAIARAVVATVASSGAAVLFAGGTVVVALCGLALAGIPTLATLGWTAALVVALAVAAANTLLPALLTVLGPRVDALRIRRSVQPDPARSGWGRLADRVTRRPWPYAVSTTLLLLALAAPTLGLRLGQLDDGDQPPGSPARAGYDLLAEGFGPGATGPVTVLAILDTPAAGRPAGTGDADADTGSTAGAGDTGSTGAGSGTTDATGSQAGTGDRSGATAADSTPDDPRVAELVRRLAAVPGVAAVAAPRVASDGLAVSVRVVPTTSPGDPDTRRTLDGLRSTTLDGMALYVTGPAAIRDEIADRVNARMPYVIIIVVALATALLLLAFRAPVLALKAAVMNMLSVGAAYGALTAVFSWGWGVRLTGLDGPVPVESYLPMMLFALLFGLSMDYEVFLLTAVAETWRATGDNRLAVRTGLAGTGRVITSAALIMVCVFGSFVLNPSPVVKMFGLGMAVAIAVDATVIRGLLVPATMAILGRVNWWTPGTLTSWRRRSPAGTGPYQEIHERDL